MCPSARAADRPPQRGAARDILKPADWTRLDGAVDRGLEFLALRQRSDGSFETHELGQPGVTGLCVLAFLARGHVPHEGRYGEQIDRAIEYVVKTQQPNGLLFDRPVEAQWSYGRASHTATYNHAIAGLMLGEVYGMTQPAQAPRVREAILKAIELTIAEQAKPKRKAIDDGGWRYLRTNSTFQSDADLSVTSWHLMFLRSARNAEFDVPREVIDQGMDYVRRAFKKKRGAFMYCQDGVGMHSTRAIVGSGILSLSMGGEHQSDEARAAGGWVLQHSFDRYNQVEHHEERYHYSVYYCSQGMFQLGGEYWARFYPPVLEVLLRNQRANGSWDAEASRDGIFGNSYTTALMILALTPPYQMLPIYQR
jgi:hypothetical protein